MSFVPLSPLPETKTVMTSRAAATIYRTKSGRFEPRVRLCVRAFVIPDFPRWFRAGASVSVSVGKDSNTGVLRIEPEGLFLIRPAPGRYRADRLPLVLLLPIFDRQLPQIATPVNVDVIPRAIDIELPSSMERPSSVPRVPATAPADALKAAPTTPAARRDGPYSLGGPSLEDITDKGRRAMRGLPAS